MGHRGPRRHLVYIASSTAAESAGLALDMPRLESLGVDQGTGKACIGCAIPEILGLDGDLFLLMALTTEVRRAGKLDTPLEPRPLPGLFAVLEQGRACDRAVEAAGHTPTIEPVLRWQQSLLL